MNGSPLPPRARIVREELGVGQEEEFISWPFATVI